MIWTSVKSIVAIALISTVGCSGVASKTEYQSDAHRFRLQYPVGWSYIAGEEKKGPITLLFTLEKNYKTGQFGVATLNEEEMEVSEQSSNFAGASVYGADVLTTQQRVNAEQPGYRVEEAGRAMFAGVSGVGMVESFSRPSGKMQRVRHFIPNEGTPYSKLWISLHSLASESDFSIEWRIIEQNWQWK